ncbi:predicted protein [Histoplasma capsulatum G186AR]|uniref:Uncharacterized protein n=2 Tax=Ajellomyces capsulatus TaxID=5037 RepID=C0NVV5_AJECG|nr:uncharacterized protein HCBG_07285 [Histoplasma capsulatum G186AR]EEH04644.1 predicted protein [Histoplasma capsulatum G186AR]KAG5296475.1 hypothetical protein I7I52_07181 [Histoplasma capsulatum]QSS74458.1 hypothetical protein I7I50_09651 [Histoplasma capsulatum G186AR]
MADSSSPDYEALYCKAEAERRQAEKRERHEGELRRQAEERESQERVRSQPTTLEELIKGCHDSFSQPLQVGTPLHEGKYSTTHWEILPNKSLLVFPQYTMFIENPYSRSRPGPETIIIHYNATTTRSCRCRVVLWSVFFEARIRHPLKNTFPHSIQAELLC